jgi:hypothetical protein
MKYIIICIYVSILEESIAYILKLLQNIGYHQQDYMAS